MTTDRVKDIAVTLDALVKLDDVYAGIEKELREKVSALRKEYEPKLAAVLKDRDTELSKGGKDAKATPAIPSFWLEVLANSEEFGQDIEEYDEPVLEYLDSIEAADIDPSDEDKGFVITFKFTENPFFTNTELRKTYTTVRSNEFTDQLEIMSIESDKIEWVPGKDVTVELVAKKKSGGGKKKKAAAAKAEPRASFFRYFRDMDMDNLPSELELEEEDEDEDQDELGRLQMFMQDDWERASSLKDLIIPRAVRWFTGEAVEADYEDEDDEEDEDEDDEEDEEDEESDEEDSPAISKKQLFAKKTAGGPNPEECKQQ